MTELCICDHAECKASVEGTKHCNSTDQQGSVRVVFSLNESALDDPRLLLSIRRCFVFRNVEVFSARAVS